MTLENLDELTHAHEVGDGRGMEWKTTAADKTGG